MNTKKNTTKTEKTETSKKTATKTTLTAKEKKKNSSTKDETGKKTKKTTLHEIVLTDNNKNSDKKNPFKFLPKKQENENNSQIKKIQVKSSQARALPIESEQESILYTALNSTVDMQEINTESMQQTEIPKEMPVLALDDTVVFNSMILPLYEPRENPMKSIDAALASHRYLFVCTQKTKNIEDPTEDDLYNVGTIVMILRMVKSPDGQMKILVKGLSRAKALKFTDKPYLSAIVECLNEEITEVHEDEKKGLILAAREQSETILSLRNIPVYDVMPALNEVEDPGILADIIAANIRLKVEDAQSLLECLNPIKRLEKVNEFLASEVYFARIDSRIQSNANEGMTKAQKHYYLKEQMKAIQLELGESSNEKEIDELRELLLKLNMPEESKKETEKQIEKLSRMNPESTEASTLRTYITWITDLPWGKYSEDILDIKQAKEVLDNDHYGLEKIKDRILEFLSVRKLNPDIKGSIICFAGPPGVGKTSLGKSIAQAMGRKFKRIALGGTRDEAEILGHRRTYVGAMPGKMIQFLKQAGTANPVILLDEIDKLSSDFRGDPSSALLEVLDPEQNVNFLDHYLNMPFDLSKVLFICTANHIENVPSALRDRLEIINLAGYMEQEKLAIAERYLLTRQIEENGLNKDDVTIKKDALTIIIQNYTREAGLRNLEREIAAICRKLARKRAEGDTSKYNVTPKMVTELLGIPRYVEEEKDKIVPPGVAQGLAWTQAGGEVLYVEASTMKGKGQLTITGQLGDVMKESATAATSYARVHADEWGIDCDFHEKLDVHIHVPAGATPKDGPSAGVTMVTALVSILSGRSVRTDTCMTGEITLRGRVLPVGGIKEKILAAVARGLKHVIIPAQNVKDLEEIPTELLKKIEVHTAYYIDDVLHLALEKNPSDVEK